MTRRQAEKIGQRALHPRARDLKAHPVAPRREERAARILARLWRRHGGPKSRERAVLRLGSRALRWRLARDSRPAALCHYGDDMFALCLLSGWTPPRRDAS